MTGSTIYGFRRDHLSASINNPGLYGCRFLMLAIIALTSSINVSSQFCGYSLPTATTSIAYYAYNGCTSLTSVLIPSTVTVIGETINDQ